MKKILFAGIAVSLLAACSNDEVVPQQNEANVIKFGVTTERNTRASDVYCNNNKFGGFTLSAAYATPGTTDKVKYIVNDEINFQNNAWENISGLRYWPNSGDITFYGYVNSDITWDNAADAPQFKDFTVDPTVSAQKDLVYAVKTQSKDDGTTVNLNFRHALSQIVFNAKNVNKSLYVEISGVEVCKVNSEGTYTFPTADTDPNVDHATENIATAANHGSWNNTQSNLASYGVTFDAVAINGDSQLKDLTTKAHTDEPTATDFTNAMLLLPQAKIEGETVTGTTAFKVGENFVEGEVDNGSYFLLDCKIWNIAANNSDTNKPTTNDVVLWPKVEGKTKILIPASFAWKEGKKYTYTFVFGNGNGGYDPENPGDDPVLVPITFDVTVDEFTPQTNESIESGVN